MKFSLITLLASAVLSVSAVPSAEVIQRSTPLATVYTKCTQPNTVALTFDDGPYDYIEDVSKKLIAAGAKGTFFFNGNNARCIYNPTTMSHVKYVYSKGHQIASHTWQHLNLTTLTSDQIHNQMWLTEQSLQRILGVTPAMMRPPFGSYNNLVRQVAAQRGQSLVTWDFDSGDSSHFTVAQSNKLYDDIAKKHPSNILALNHEIFNTTVYDVLPHALSVLKAKKYKMVTVAECLGKKPYQKVVTPPKADPSWWC